MTLPSRRKYAFTLVPAGAAVVVDAAVGAAVAVAGGAVEGVGVVDAASRAEPQAAATSGSAAIVSSRRSIGIDFVAGRRTPTCACRPGTLVGAGGSAIIRRVSWFAVVVLACALVVLVAAEWPRLDERIGGEARRRRDRAKRKRSLKVVRSDSDDFAASVERDLANLPTIEEREERR